MVNNNGYQLASKIKTPTLIVHGSKDVVVPIEQSMKSAKLIPNCQLAVIKGADHTYTNPSHANQMTKIITDFIISKGL